MKKGCWSLSSFCADRTSGLNTQKSPRSIVKQLDAPKLIGSSRDGTRMRSQSETKVRDCVNPEEKHVRPLRLVIHVFRPRPAVSLREEPHVTSRCLPQCNPRTHALRLLLRTANESMPPKHCFACHLLTRWIARNDRSRDAQGLSGWLARIEIHCIEYECDGNRSIGASKLTDYGCAEPSDSPSLRGFGRHPANPLIISVNHPMT